jgi:hypothetical protein
MAEKRKRTPARRSRSEETERKIQSLRRGTFEERTQMIEDYIDKLDRRIAARKASEAAG